MPDPRHYHVQARSVRLVGFRRHRQNHHRYEIIVITPKEAWKEGEAIVGLAVLDTAKITNRARLSTLQSGGGVELRTSRLSEHGSSFRVESQVRIRECESSDCGTDLQRSVSREVPYDAPW